MITPEKKEYNRIWREQNKAKIKESTLLWRKKNIDKIRQKRKESYWNNRKRDLEYVKNYNKENKEIVKERRKIHYNENREELLRKKYEYRQTPKGKKADLDYYNNNIDKIKNTQKLYNEKNEKLIKERHKMYKLTHKEQLHKYYEEKGKHKERISRYRRSYNISIEEYNIIFESQKGCCAICGIHQENIKKLLSVDHCHITGKIRELLCNKCNSAIGLLKEDITILESAINYIKKHILC